MKKLSILIPLRPSMASLLLLLFLQLLAYQSPPRLCDSLGVGGVALLRFKEGVELDPYRTLSGWGEDNSDPCLWFSVECSGDRRVVSLNLKDLSLKETLMPDLGKLMKSFLLSNI